MTPGSQGRLSAAWCAWICVVQAFPSLSHSVTGIRGSLGSFAPASLLAPSGNALKLVISFVKPLSARLSETSKLEENRPAE